MVEPRIEPVKPFSKKLVNKEAQVKKFEKEISVFKDWKEDNEKIYKQCIEHDQMYWKLHKFIKDLRELENVKEFLIEKMDIIREIHVNLQGESHSFPGVNNMTMSDFAVKMKFIDKNFKISDSERIFINTQFRDQAAIDQKLDDKSKKAREK